jgi:hypothetical protein
MMVQTQERPPFENEDQAVLDTSLERRGDTSPFGQLRCYGLNLTICHHQPSRFLN